MSPIGLKSRVVTATLTKRDAPIYRDNDAELALPWKGLGVLARAGGQSLPPNDGDIWRMDFSRFNTYKDPSGSKDSGGWACRDKACLVSTGPTSTFTHQRVVAAAGS